MASLSFSVLLVAFAFAFTAAHAADPDITSDFIVPSGVSSVDANFFTFKGFRQSLSGSPSSAPLKVTKASEAEFPALAGQSVSYAFLEFGPGAINPPHTHPRSAELLMVIQGALSVGLVDSSGKLFTQQLEAGDVFVFPKGLVHFQVNKDAKNLAIAVSAFGSANPGTVSLPKAIFGSGIDGEVLAASFKTDAATASKLVSANMG
ncbi:Germin-like protein 9-1 [Apostasia shenzhenica]|uniref:Germin-like protein n=1 Tax=Apostasia shenzhenica TaxID=1088818 RepID=A0A2I0B5F5_9ASPA|nr:Germin-like protein 9-1 [Apostasia shenzhenica]